MTSVTGPVGGFGLARGYTRLGLVFTALLFTSLPLLALRDDGWPHPVLHPLSLGLLAVALAVFAAHQRLVRPTGAAAAPAGQAVAAALVPVAAGTAVAVGMVAPEAAAIWLVIPGQALSVLLAARGWRRAELAAGAVVVLAALGVLLTSGFAEPPRGWAWPLVLAVFLAGPALTDRGSVGLIRVLDRLEAARRDADELATTRERVRIAAELHDVQGHSLHAIALHAELAERLIGTDPETAARHAHTVRTLAADALAETRALVRGYRSADLAGELRNAAGLLRAAGAEAGITGSADAVPAAHAALLGPVVREAATNVLRHSDPSRVTFTLHRAGDRTELVVRNDGVPAAPEPPDPYGGTGLAGLRDRVGTRGGNLVAGPDGDGGWELRVVLLGGTADPTSGVDDELGRVPR